MRYIPTFRVDLVEFIMDAFYDAFSSEARLTKMVDT